MSLPESTSHHENTGNINKLREGVCMQNTVEVNMKEKLTCLATSPTGRTAAEWDY